MYQTCPVIFTPSPIPTSARELGRTRAPATIVLACLCVLASGVPYAAAQDAPDPAGDHLEGLPSSSDAGAPIDEEAPDMLQKGAWKYKIPIEVPPAPRDLKPKLEFVASHTQRDGLLGRGWNLAGFSAIERHGANGGVPEMRDTDSFWLDGLRLVEIGDRLYRLEKDDNRVFEFDAEAQSWTAFRDGWAWRWGEYDGSSKGTSGVLVGSGATEHWRESAKWPADCGAPRRLRGQAERRRKALACLVDR